MKCYQLRASKILKWADLLSFASEISSERIREKTPQSCVSVKIKNERFCQTQGSAKESQSQVQKIWIPIPIPKFFKFNPNPNPKIFIGLRYDMKYMSWKFVSFKSLVYFYAFLDIYAILNRTHLYRYILSHWTSFLL